MLFLTVVIILKLSITESDNEEINSKLSFGTTEKGTIINTRVKRQLTTNENWYWKKMPILYKFDGTHDSKQKDQIRAALKFYEDNTCLRYKEVGDIGKSYGLIFMKGKGCYSYVGRVKAGGQNISLGDSCFIFGTMLHEIAHSLGFFHEQTRPDRQAWVEIHKENIEQYAFANFEIVPWEKLKTQGYPYDIGSVMHYSDMGFSKNFKKVMTTKDKLLQSVMGNRRKMSFYDLKAINTAYCSKSCHTKHRHKCRNRGYPHPNNCNTCVCPTGLAGHFCQSLWQSSGKEFCGGVKFLSDFQKIGHIQSPGLQNFYYHKNQKCNWLFLSDKHSIFRLHFEFHYFALECCKWSTCPSGKCKDYIEVRYYPDLAITGPKFCTCNVPPRVIYSHSNKVMILFSSTTGGIGGFKMQYKLMKCGGCAVGRGASKYEPCHALHTFTCHRRYKKRTRGCFIRPAKNCRVETQYRRTKCQTVTPYCCLDYELKAGKCYRQ